MFAFGANIEVPLRPAAAGGTHSRRILMGSSPVLLKNKQEAIGLPFILVRVTGLEPARLRVGT